MAALDTLPRPVEAVPQRPLHAVLCLPAPQPTHLVPAMTDARFSWSVSPAGTIMGSYWKAQRPAVTVAERERVEAHDLATMSTTPWNADTRLDWLIAASLSTGLPLDYLHPTTREWFGPLDPSANA